MRHFDPQHNNVDQNKKKSKASQRDFALRCFLHRVYNGAHAYWKLKMLQLTMLLNAKDPPPMSVRQGLKVVVSFTNDLRSKNLLNERNEWKNALLTNLFLSQFR